MADEFDELMNGRTDAEDLEAIAQELCDQVNLKIMEYPMREQMTIARKEAKLLYHEMLATYGLSESEKEQVGMIFSEKMKQVARHKLFGKRQNDRATRRVFKMIERQVERRERKKC